MTVTVLLGLASAICWGAPDLWLAQASRKLGAVPVVFGSVLVGLIAVAPIAAFVDPPDWTTRGVVIALLLGPLSVVGYLLAFTAFRGGAVSIVAPIVACEGGMAALFAISAGERLPALVALFLPIAVLGVVLAAMGRGGGRAAAVPAAAAAVVWGGILALSAPAADDLGGYWSFLLTRGAALVVCLGLGAATGGWRTWLDDRWRVAAWGIGDSAAYLLFLVAADRGPVSVASVLVAQFATVAVVVGLLFGGERLLRRQVVGVALVIVAVTGIAAAGG